MFDPRVLPVAAAAVLCALLVGTRSQAGDGSDGSARPPAAGRRVVLVELFTSQGCSSCPAADRQLVELGTRTGAGPEVVPLAFHVDYWNSIGWRDPFSSPAWTERQRAYAGAFRSGRVYTPQAVIDGRIDVVGSHAGRLAAEVAEAAQREGASVALRVRRSSSVALEAQAQVSRPAALRGRRLDLMLAVYENELVTAVASGENARRTLRNGHVVRRLERAAELPALPAGAAAEAAVTFRLALDESWRAAHLGIAAFLQDPETLQVEGAAAVTLPQ